MEHWSDDPRFWDRLDKFAKDAGLDFKRLADVLFEYNNQLDPHIAAMLFGGVGSFLKTYNLHEGEPREKFGMAMRAVHENPRMQKLFSGMTMEAIDSKVENMQRGV